MGERKTSKNKLVGFTVVRMLAAASNRTQLNQRSGFGRGVKGSGIESRAAFPI